MGTNVLTLFGYPLGLRALDALVLSPPVGGGVDSQPGVGATLQLHQLVLAGSLAPELICDQGIRNKEETPLRMRLHTKYAC